MRRTVPAGMLKNVGRRRSIFVLYFSGICAKIENDRLVGTGSMR
jgi:hypothetical protein